MAMSVASKGAPLVKIESQIIKTVSSGIFNKGFHIQLVDDITCKV